MSKIYAIIPARKGSKRIKNKNMINFFGKPLISWTIDVAMNCNLFHDVIVSSDSDQILDISKKMGAHSFKRYKHCDDHSTISQATLYTALSLKLNKNDIIVQLMPNCPLRTKENIVHVYNFFKNLKYHDSVISCFKFGWMNPWWALKKEGTNFVQLFNNKYNKRSQDLENLYCPTGSIWITRLKTLINKNSFYTKKHTFFEIPFDTAIDIDDEDDLKISKVLYIIKRENM